MSMFLCSKGVPRPPYCDTSIKGVFSEINTGDAIYHVKEHLDGSQEAMFHPKLLLLLEDMFKYNSMKFLSLEQERFLHMFFNQAHTVTEAMRNEVEDPFQDMAELMKQFDNFLGSYSGENDE